MLRALVVLLVRSLLELAVVLLAVAAILLVLSFRIGRRLVTTGDDPLERLSARALQISSMFPRRPPAPVDQEEHYVEDPAAE